MAFDTEAASPVRAAPSPDDPPRLNRRALGLPDITASTIASMAPAYAILLALSSMVAVGGLPLPLTLIAGAAAIALLCSTLAQFSRSLPSTGSFATFIGKAFGPVTGITTVLILTVGYIVAISGVMAVSGDFIRSVLNDNFGFNPPWQLVTLVLILFVAFMVLEGVKISTEVALALVSLEIVYLVISSIMILIHNADSLSLQSLDPGNYTNGLHGFGIAFAFGVFLYLGWEGSASLAEETDNPRRNVPRALFLALGLIVLILLLGAYALVTGFHNNAEAILASESPFLDVAHGTAGFLKPLGQIAGISSVIGVLIANTNSQSRLIFNFAREGLVPGASALGQVSARKRAPWAALLAYIVLGALLIVVFGWSKEPEEFLGEMGTLGTIPIIVVYIFAHLSLPIYWRRYHPDTFKPLVHLVIPIIGIASLAYPLWLLIEPGQDAPFNQYPWMCLGLIAVSLVYAVIVNARKPGLSERLGSIVADE